MQQSPPPPTLPPTQNCHAPIVPRFFFLQAATAIRRLKDACFKVDVHLMPNLPGASLLKDRRMFERMLREPPLQADQWKIYPTQVYQKMPIYTKKHHMPHM